MATERSGTAAPVRALADSFHERWLATYPFVASIYGIPGYDDRVPDESEEGEAARRAELESVLAQARGFDSPQLSDADVVTLGCLVENINQELRDIDARLIEHTVSAMPVSSGGLGGSSGLARTARRTCRWGREAGSGALGRAAARAAAAGPVGRAGGSGPSFGRRGRIRGVPAVVHHLAAVRGGIHRIGLEALEAVEARMLELGSHLRLSSLVEIHRAARESSKLRPSADALAAAISAIRRAEAATPEFFTEPFPPPCDVAPMPSVIAASGMAPHYSPPRLDGGRPGTFWFNLERPTAGTGWDLEVVAFHEGVPGHHLQLSRIRMLDDLSDMQRQRSLSVFSEGWALYAEQLADEMGLYSGLESQIGALVTSLLRAARLVVDTGLHALGWSRQRATEFLIAHVPMPEEFMANEVDRYIVYPAQAVTYVIGKRELLRLRDEAERHAGPRFALPEFHAAVLDSGSLPMPVLGDKLRRWSAE